MMTSQSSGQTNGSPFGTPPPTPRPSMDLSYMHRPPTIMPNYGKNYGNGLKLKTSVPRVLLYDNVTQQTILDFQLSGLQSQQLKTNRELQNHMKSFSLQRQLREKALRNITKVPHWSDYEEFQRTYQEQTIAHDKGRLLPQFNNSRENLVSSNSTTRRKKNRIGNEKTRNLFPNKSDINILTKPSQGVFQHVVNGHDNDNFKTGRSSLPQIDISAPLSTVSVNSPVDSIGRTQHFEPRRQVGFRIEKGDKGVTRIFHALPSTGIGERQTADTGSKLDEPTSQPSEQETTTISELGKRAYGANCSDEEIAAIDEVNITPEYNQTIPLETELITEESSNENNVLLIDVHAVTDFEPHLDHPLHDYRFELLHRSLVIQDPPNEGFIELSPSFPKTYPDTTFLNEFKRTVARKTRTCSREDAQSMYSDDGASHASGDHQSYFEHEEHVL